MHVHRLSARARRDNKCTRSDSSLDTLVRVRARPARWPVDMDQPRAAYRLRAPRVNFMNNLGIIEAQLNTDACII